MQKILVVGANRGIGLELCKELQARGAQIIATCRESSEELKALGCAIISGIDLVSDDAMVTLNDALETQSPNGLDGVIVNAGVLSRETLKDLDFDRIRLQLEVNALGPLRVVGAIHPRVKRGGKIAIITSRMGSLKDNSSGGFYGYRMSKAAVNMAAVSLSKDLAPQEIAIGLLHPGYVRTRMTNFSGELEPQESAKLLVDRFEALSMATTGSFTHCSGEALPW